MTPIERMGVVVPAHDEQDWLAACLRALQLAATRSSLPVELLVVLDACSDGTATVAAEAGVRTLEVRDRNVGLARAAGFGALSPHGDTRQWLATTDADSLVPPDWLVRMTEYADAGWDVVVGAVEVEDWVRVGREEGVRAAWQRTYSATNRPVHGANLGFRASSYRGAGGMPGLALAEDAGLVTALESAGSRVLHAPDLAVCTSARHSARAPGGFSTYLDELSA